MAAMSNNEDAAAQSVRKLNTTQSPSVRKLATTKDLVHRHDRGYDPLDKLFQAERRRMAADGDEVEHKRVLTSLMTDHVEAMRLAGTVFSHGFQRSKLGFFILIAKFGAEGWISMVFIETLLILGRQFIEVDETMPHCELFESKRLLPTDELIMINDEFIIEPSSLDGLRKQIAEAPRPLKLTFVQGERREEAFEEQEECRRMRNADIVLKKSQLASQSALCVKSAEWHVDDAKKCATLGDVEGCKTCERDCLEDSESCEALVKEAQLLPAYLSMRQEKEDKEAVRATEADLEAVREALKSIKRSLAAAAAAKKGAPALAKEARAARVRAEEAAKKGDKPAAAAAADDARAAADAAKANDGSSKAAADADNEAKLAWVVAASTVSISATARRKDDEEGMKLREAAASLAKQAEAALKAAKGAKSESEAEKAAKSARDFADEAEVLSAEARVHAATAPEKTAKRAAQTLQICVGFEAQANVAASEAERIDKRGTLESLQEEEEEEEHARLTEANSQLKKDTSPTAVIRSS